MSSRVYTGRFAPSPTGPLHAGSLVAALASWLDARAHGGSWLLRIEDIDPPRCPPGMDQEILRQLHALQLVPDAPPQWQSARHSLYAQALAQLQAAGWAYPCACTRRDMDAALAAQGHVHERHGERPYPGTCRDGLHGRTGRSWRFHTQRYQQHASAAAAQDDLSPTPDHPVLHSDQQLGWQDRWLGPMQQDVAASVGDFLVQRADGLWAYQLAVVVDDAAQGISDVVRGADLADNTPRQLLLQRALGLPAPRYMHTPLVLQADGEKLSKQYGAPAVVVDSAEQRIAVLRQAAQHLGLEAGEASSIPDALADWTAQWARRHLATT
ncbi:tRNA glutamyl-Q(34) synthetase GluQRS [Comamonas sp. MYb396]|uniref:tRNA glutamyl-Q(34) synthetase GluQRS n=1 Tax=Comamonas sp. MYb396 TaxID=2745302 RepID=UPI0030A23B99